jgi:hypothetical protein
MAKWTLRRGKPEVLEQPSLARVLTENDVVSVNSDNGYIIVTPKAVTLADPQSIDLREIGATSVSPWNGWFRMEYNPDMRGLTGLRKFDEMRRSDSDIHGSLLMAKTPVLGARWFIEPATKSSRDKNIADHVWWNLTEGMSTSWPQFLTELLLMLDFGFYSFEKVFTVNHPKRPGMACWKKFSPRHPMDIQGWCWDANGGPNGIEVWTPDGGMGGSIQEIPIEKLLIFTNAKEGGDMTGISVLRSAYKAWYYKQNLEKIDAIQKERHSVGVPVIKLPPNFNNADKNLANEMGRNLRTNERGHVVLPPNWELIFAKIEGQPVDTLASIEYHSKQIWTNVLAQFMTRTTGSSAKDDDQIMFLKATKFTADVVCDVMNKFAIPQLVDFNWLRVKNYPKLRVRRIGEQADWRTVSFAVRNLIGAGVIRPDDKLEENLREEMDLPEVDLASVREVSTPQAGPKPARTGPPRQGPPSANQGGGGANAGRDGSGG